MGQTDDSKQNGLHTKERKGVMTKIQNKLMIYVAILILLMSAVSFWIYVSSQRSIQQYDDILQRFLVLNEISQTTRALNETIDRYTLDPTSEHVEQYEANKKALMERREELWRIMDKPEYRWILKNYYHMIGYTTDHMDKTFVTFEEGSMEYFDSQLNEVKQLSDWVKETTLELIHMELRSYHEFISDVIARNRFYHTLGASTSAAFLVLSLLFTYFFSNGITRPIRRLALQARQISHGNFNSPPIPVTTRDEVGLLTETFNRMKSDIRMFIAEMKEKAVLERKLQEQTIKSLEMDHLLKEMELKTLQSQINPHFLFNTLNTLSKMAYVEGAERTSELIVTVSRLFRYNLKQIDQTVTLQDELYHVRAYVDIQKERFGTRIGFTMEVDPACLSQALPSLTIQPLIENAYKHGVDSLTDKASIRLKAYATSSHVVIEVHDNGVGIDDDQLATFRKGQPLTSSDSTGIGLHNVVRRLQLFYEREQVMEIESQRGEGTVVRLLLPPVQRFDKGGEIHDVHIAHRR